MELVMGVLLFGLVIYIKLGMIKEFLATWKEAKVKAILLFVKNSAFFSIWSQGCKLIIKAVLFLTNF